MNAMPNIDAARTRKRLMRISISSIDVEQANPGFCVCAPAKIPGRFFSRPEMPDNTKSEDKASLVSLKIYSDPARQALLLMRLTTGERFMQERSEFIETTDGRMEA